MGASGGDDALARSVQVGSILLHTDARLSAHPMPCRLPAIPRIAVQVHFRNPYTLAKFKAQYPWAGMQANLPGTKLLSNNQQFGLPPLAKAALLHTFNLTKSHYNRHKRGIQMLHARDLRTFNNLRISIHSHVARVLDLDKRTSFRLCKLQTKLRDVKCCSDLGMDLCLQETVGCTCAIPRETKLHRHSRRREPVHDTSCEVRGGGSASPPNCCKLTLTYAT